MDPGVLGEQTESLKVVFLLQPERIVLLASPKTRTSGLLYVIVFTSFLLWDIQSLCLPVRLGQLRLAPLAAGRSDGNCSC